MMMLQALRTSALFAREWAGGPAAVGAVCPSSRWLAVQIARQVPRGDGAVIELGGGTGAVTKGLLENGVAAERLIVVERTAAFVRHLRYRFPRVPVLHGDAKQLTRILPLDLRVDAIVSCLPLRSLPTLETMEIVEQWRRILTPQGVVIQFTYDIRPLRELADYAPDFVSTTSRIVWANLPPARIVTLRRRTM